MSESTYGVTGAVPPSITGTEVGPAPSGALIGGVDVEAVAAAVQGCAGVSALDSGQFGVIASYLPGRRVPGVVVRDWSVLVGVCSRWGVKAADLFAQIASAAAPLIGRRWVEVAIGDIDDPPEPARVPPSGLEGRNEIVHSAVYERRGGQVSFPGPTV
jgi:hypothetical protein